LESVYIKTIVCFLSGIITYIFFNKYLYKNIYTRYV